MSPDFRRLLGRSSVPVDNFSEQIDLARGLDNLGKLNPVAWDEARLELSAIAPEVIYSRFGETVLAWAAIIADKPRAKMITKKLAELADYDEALFAKAHRWVKETSQSDDPRRADLVNVLAEYRVEKTIMGRDLDLDLPSMLKSAARPGVEIDDRRTRDFALQPVKVWGSRISGFVPEASPEPSQTGGYQYRIGLDTPTGFVLRYKAIPHAILGLAAAGPQELMIYHMQGVLGKQRDVNEQVVATRKPGALAQIHWHQLLFSVAESVGRALDAESIAVQEGAQNRWHTQAWLDEAEPHLSLEVAVKAYDVPAQRAGFSRGEDGNWHRPIVVP